MFPEQEYEIKTVGCKILYKILLYDSLNNILSHIFSFLLL